MLNFSVIYWTKKVLLALFYVCAVYIFITFSETCMLKRKLDLSDIRFFLEYSLVKCGTFSKGLASKLTFTKGVTKIILNVA